MKIAVIFLIIIALSACSNNNDVDKRSDISPDQAQTETAKSGPDSDVGSFNPNMIRKQTESSFRGIKSKDNKNFKPSAPSTPGIIEDDKK